MLRLRLILQRLASTGAGSQSALAERLDLSRSALANWCTHDRWPARRSHDELAEAVTGYLREAGADQASLDTWAERLSDQAAAQHRPRAGRRPATDPAAPDGQPTIEDDTVLLRGQKLTPEAKLHWGTPFRDPFRGEIQSSADLWLSPDARYVREAMRATAEHGGFTAVVGESGSGKTTLLKDLKQWVIDGKRDVVVVEPYVIDMEEHSGGRRRSLTARDLATAIIHTLAPHDRVRQDSQARFRQAHELLREASRSKLTVVLVIEEAHGIPRPLLTHLKRYLEMSDGLKPLLAIMLIGQPELLRRLSPLDASIREIVQRVDLVTLRPLDERIGEYLRHKLSRCSLDIDSILSAGLIEAMRERLTPRVRRGETVTDPSLVHPLSVNNLCVALMNWAAATKVGGPQAADPKQRGPLPASAIDEV